MKERIWGRLAGVWLNLPALGRLGHAAWPSRDQSCPAAGSQARGVPVTDRIKSLTLKRSIVFRSWISSSWCACDRQNQKLDPQEINRVPQLDLKLVVRL